MEIWFQQQMTLSNGCKMFSVTILLSFLCRDETKTYVFVLWKLKSGFNKGLLIGFVHHILSLMVNMVIRLVNDEIVI